MTLKQDNFTLMVSVVGLSGHGRTFHSSSNGVGKSCLCCRFLHSGVDDYVPDHPSLLALHEFEGQVVSAEPLLYWGRRTLELATEGNGKPCNVTFEVFEHTVFYHDETSHPFSSLHKLTNRADYAKRLNQTPECTRKFSYYSRDTIGFPESYNCVPVPANMSKLERGVIVVIDLSKDIEYQLDNTDAVLSTKLKKLPIVIAATKRDKSFTETHILRRARLTEWASKDKIPVVETSAHENINVEDVFRVVAAKALRKKKKILHSYLDYAGATGCMLTNHTRTKNEFHTFLNRRVLYSDTPLSTIENTEQYKALVRLIGKFNCDELFAKHVLEMRNKEVMEYDGVKENPDLQLDLLEEFIERSSDLFAHEAMLRTLATSLSKIMSTMYVNEGGISPRHVPSHAVPVPATEPETITESEQSTSYVKFSRSNSPATMDVPIDDQPIVSDEATSSDENNDAFSDKSDGPSTEDRNVFTYHGDLTSETGQDVIEIYDVVPGEQPLIETPKPSIKNRAAELGKQLHGTGSSSSDKSDETASSDEEVKTRKSGFLPPAKDQSVVRNRDESTGLSGEASTPRHDHLTVQPRTPNNSIKARAAALQRKMSSKGGDESADSKSSSLSTNMECSGEQSAHPVVEKSTSESFTACTASKVDPVSTTGLPSITVANSSTPVEVMVSSSAARPVPTKVEITIMPGVEKQSPKPPVLQKPKKPTKSPYEHTTHTASRNQILVNQTLASSSQNTSSSTHSSTNDLQQQAPVPGTANSPSMSFQPKLSKPPPVRPKPSLAVGATKPSSNSPKVPPKSAHKRQNYQDTIPAEKAQAAAAPLPPKASLFDSVPASNSSPTIPTQMSADSGAVRTRPRRQDYEPRLPGLRQKMEKEKQQVLTTQERKMSGESLQESWEKTAEPERQNDGMEKKQTEEKQKQEQKSQQVQQEVAEEQAQLKNSNRQPEVQHPVPEPTNSGTTRRKPRKDYEPRLPFIRQKREMEKEQERIERERAAELEKQQAEMKMKSKEQQQLEALRLRPNLPAPDYSADLARVLTQLQKENKAPPAPHIGISQTPNSSLPSSSFATQGSSFSTNIPSVDIPRSPQHAPPPNYPAPNPHSISYQASPVTRRAPVSAVTSSLPVSMTPLTHSPPHTLASFHSDPGADEPPPIPTRTSDMYLPGGQDTALPAVTQEASSTATPPAEKKDRKNYSFIKLRWKSKKSSSAGDGKSGEVDKESSTPSAPDSSGMQQPQPQPTSSRPRGAKPVVNMRRRALPPEPELADLINKQSSMGDICPEDYEIMDAEQRAKLRPPAHLFAGPEPPHPVPVNVTMSYPVFYPPGMLGTVATSFMGAVPMTTQHAAQGMYPQAMSAYPFHQMAPISPEIGAAHGVNMGYPPQFWPDTRPPAPLPTASPSPSRINAKRHSASLTPSRQPVRSLSVREGPVPTSSTDDDGYENTESWGIPPIPGSKGYSYARQERFSPSVMFPRTRVVATPPRDLQHSVPACATSRRTKQTLSSASDEEDEEDYVNMQSELNLDPDYENFETIQLVQESHLILPGGAGVPPPVPSKSSRHHQRRHSMDDHIYYNEEFQELLEEWRKQYCPETESQVGSPSSHSPKKHGQKPVPSSRQPKVSITEPPSEDFSKADGLFAPIKQPQQQTFAQTDEETGQVHAQQAFSTHSLPKQKPKPYLPPRNIPRPMPAYLDIIN